ncbi:hypothetical protein KR059_010668, partial [Drosophila kikkawai]
APLLQTLAVLFCACIVGSCYANYGGRPGYGHGGYGQERSSGSGGAASAASSAASSNEGRGYERYERPVEIIAGGHRGGYGQNHEILRPINIGSYGHGRRGPSYNRGYGPRWTVQPAGATLLYPGQNNYRAYVSPPEYSKVILPVRAAEPVAKLYVPEHGYGQEYRERPYGGPRGGY